MNMTDKASQYAHEAGDKIADAGHQAAHALGGAGDQIMDAEQCLVKNCSGYVRDQPLVSLGIAVAAGFILSRLLSQNSH